MPLHPYCVTMLLSLAIVGAGCDGLYSESEEPRECTVTVSLQDEIADELSDIENAQSEVADVASEIEDTIVGLRSRGNSSLEDLQSSLEEAANKLQEVHDSLAAKEIEAECGVR